MAETPAIIKAKPRWPPPERVPWVSPLMVNIGCFQRVSSRTNARKNSIKYRSNYRFNAIWRHAPIR
jgi:hypothetical protein